MSNNDENYTQIDLTRSYNKNLSALKRFHQCLPWWLHIAAILLLLYWASRLYSKLVIFSRERAYRMLVMILSITSSNRCLVNSGEDMAFLIAIKDHSS